MKCPKCKSNNTVPIAYGYPADEEEYLQQVAEKKIIPGGCCIESDSPQYGCIDCDFRW